MIPVTFGGCLGWLHEARGTPKGRRGVVLCGATGYEGLCAYRSWYELAEEIALWGCPTLRFDYPGAGDSLDPEAQSLDAYKDSIIAAIATLKAQTGVSEIVLVGLRLGAALALAVAEEREHIVRLVLLAPVLSGKAYLRELKMQSRLMARATATQKGSDEADGLEVGGLVLTGAMLDDLKSIDTLQSAKLAAPRVLVAEAPLQVGDRRLQDRLRHLGARVETDALIGYDAMLSDPTTAKVPPVWPRIARWVTEDAPDSPACAITAGPAELATAHFRERVVRFGPTDLVGVICRPAEPLPASPVLVIANGGRNPRFGWARGTVELARQLAGEGITSFRFDCAGLGDSPADPNRQGEMLYSEWPFRDMTAALDWLQAEGLGPFIAMGLCAGGYLSLHATVRDTRLIGFIAVNLYNFIWKPGTSLDVVNRRIVRATAFYRRRLFERETWRQLFTGKIDALHVFVGLLTREAERCTKKLSVIAGRLSGRETETDRIRRWFADLSRRGAKGLLVYSRDDPGIEALTAHFGPAGEGLNRYPGFGVRFIADADHSLTPAWARAELAGHIRSFIAACMPVKRI
ncbi:alpha/beta fold hydrolase [Chelatococcus sp. GCM10030263]|uniref:alpha/beta fold hydrolase n=1 Tax=Chelatococcus sp. GCM10030263 TaxID=3273387 RepID=UPI00361A9CF3